MATKVTKKMRKKTTRVAGNKRNTITLTLGQAVSLQKNAAKNGRAFGFLDNKINNA